MGRILPIELKVINATFLSETPTEFGSPFLNPAVKINFFNTSDEDAYVLQDDVTPYLLIPAGGTLTLDESFLYKNGIDQEYYFPRGTQLFLQSVTATPTKGYIISHIVTRIQP